MVQKEKWYRRRRGTSGSSTSSVSSSSKTPSPSPDSAGSEIKLKMKYDSSMNYHIYIYNTHTYAYSFVHIRYDSKCVYILPPPPPLLSPSLIKNKPVLVAPGAVAMVTDVSNTGVNPALVFFTGITGVANSCSFFIFTLFSHLSISQRTWWHKKTCINVYTYIHTFMVKISITLF